MKNIEEIISANVRKIREEKEISSHLKLAQLADMHINAIQKLESGMHSPTAATIAKVALALSVQPYQLLMEDPYAIEPKPSPTVTAAALEFSREIETKNARIKSLENELAKEQAEVSNMMDVNRELSDTIDKLEKEIEKMKIARRPESIPYDVWGALTSIEKPAVWNKLRAVLKIPRSKSRKEEAG